MNDLLIKYLSNNGSKYVHIIYAIEKGVDYEVKFYTDDSHHYFDTKTINIWDVMVFLNNGITQIETSNELDKFKSAH